MTTQPNALPAYLTPVATAAIKAENAAHHAHLANLRRERIYRELMSKMRRPGKATATRCMAAFPLVGVAS